MLFHHKYELKSSTFQIKKFENGGLFFMFIYNKLLSTNMDYRKCSATHVMFIINIMRQYIEHILYARCCCRKMLLNVSTKCSLSTYLIGFPTKYPLWHCTPIAWLTMDSLKDHCSRTRDIVCFFPFILLPCKNLAPTLPTMQLERQQFGRRFRYLMLQ